MKELQQHDYNSQPSQIELTARCSGYCCPSLDNRIIIIADPMLATGASIIKTIEHMKSEGTPAAFHVVVAIASTVGIAAIEKACGTNVKIWCGDIDNELTAKGYIVPGLGDAGDLAFGTKSQA